MVGREKDDARIYRSHLKSATTSIIHLSSSTTLALRTLAHPRIIYNNAADPQGFLRNLAALASLQTGSLTLLTAAPAAVVLANTSRHPHGTLQDRRTRQRFIPIAPAVYADPDRIELVEHNGDLGGWQRGDEESDTAEPAGVATGEGGGTAADGQICNLVSSRREGGL